MPLLIQWDATWSALGVARTAALRDIYDDLIARYSEPHRKYHTLRHLDECLATFADHRALAEHPAEVEVALWFHDAIYDTRSNRNEAESAALAVAVVRGAGMSTECAQRIEDLVMATRHDAIPSGADARILVDVDLSILAADPERFDEYERQVRAEYAWVPGYLFRKERRKILHGFLARPAIFSTLELRARHEAQARANLKRSLEALGG